jgi:hypothetical protein
VYPPDEWRSEALFDKIAEVARNLPPHPTLVGGWRFSFASFLILYQPEKPIDSALLQISPKRRLQLHGVSKISSLTELGPFFAQASLANYELLYATRGHLDWQLIHNDILSDMFSQ